MSLPKAAKKSRGRPRNEPSFDWVMGSIAIAEFYRRRSLGEKYESALDAGAQAALAEFPDSRYSATALKRFIAKAYPSGKSTEMFFEVVGKQLHMSIRDRVIYKMARRGR